ncbi:hypothetical protein [Lysinibacillus capsici]|uniref:hypothetical protein n=1 Tax=Lysinibacillus TaxID=400634 RepID=UPI003D80C665
MVVAIIFLKNGFNKVFKIYHYYVAINEKITISPIFVSILVSLDVLVGISLLIQFVNVYICMTAVMLQLFNLFLLFKPSKGGKTRNCGCFENIPININIKNLGYNYVKFTLIFLIFLGEIL